MGAKTVINLVLICWAVFITGVSLTLITPFYPTEALAKGVSVTQTGVVLSTVFIAAIVFTPIFGKERTSLTIKGQFLYDHVKNKPDEKHNDDLGFSNN